jgi:hypothetical protein
MTRQGVRTAMGWAAVAVLVAGCIPVVSDRPASRFTVSDLQHAEDALMSRQEGGRTVFDVVCPSGIGHATVTAADDWPATLTVRLRYAADKPFTRLEKFGGALSKGPAEDERLPTVRLQSDVLGQGQVVTVEVHVPPEVRGWRTLRLMWIDAYR